MANIIKTNGIDHHIRDFTRDGAVYRYKSENHGYWKYGFFTNSKLESLGVLAPPSSVDTDSKRGGPGKSIKCIDTGRVYDSQRQACENLGITPAALCNHLKGRTGYNTVGGLKFDRVDQP